MSAALDWSTPFERLLPGQAFLTRGRTVTEADVVGFAALTGDRHPQHTDASWSAGSQFGERIAHGMLIVSYAVGLVPFDPDRVVALRRIADVTFKRPLMLGDTIRVAGKIDALSAVNDELGLVGWTWSVLNQDQRLVCRARLEVLWRGGAAPPPARAGDKHAAPSDEIAGGAALELDESASPYAFEYPAGVFPC
jgi:3-hydroxybutyryl-CoA dehydratase